MVRHQVEARQLQAILKMLLYLESLWRQIGMYINFLELCLSSCINSKYRKCQVLTSFSLFSFKVIFKFSLNFDISMSGKN